MEQESDNNHVETIMTAEIGQLCKFMSTKIENLNGIEINLYTTTFNMRSDRKSSVFTENFTELFFRRSIRISTNRVTCEEAQAGNREHLISSTLFKMII